jgi:ribosomal protein L27
MVDSKLLRSAYSDQRDVVEARRVQDRSIGGFVQPGRMLELQRGTLLFPSFERQ